MSGAAICFLNLGACALNAVGWLWWGFEDFHLWLSGLSLGVGLMCLQGGAS